MRFTFNPDDAPPRIVRFVSPLDMPADDVLATLDVARNLLRINLELYQQMEQIEQERVLRTQLPMITVSAA